ncbi:MAG: 3-hydroxyacyl-CoA dehydrogenase family protein [Gemmatimonadota bacterium]
MEGSERGRIRSAAVVGAGTMGNGIAHVFALAGLSVRLIDVEEKALEGALDKIRGNLGRQQGKGVISEAEAGAALARIQTALDLDAAADVEIAVEAVPEDEALKARILAELGRLAPPDAILASNTSSISISALAGRTPGPGRVIGMHFMNPVPVMRLVEVVRGLETTDEATADTVELCRRLEKTPVVVRDYPGFVSNRILMPMINEAVYCLMEGVADPEAIDTVMKLGMNHPMGPLALADLIGLDVCLAVCEVLHRDLGEDKYRPCPLLRKYVAAGRLGRKAGRGFYSYGDA